MYVVSTGVDGAELLSGRGLVKCDVIIGGELGVTVCDRGREGLKLPKKA